MGNIIIKIVIGIVLLSSISFAELASAKNVDYEIFGYKLGKKLSLNTDNISYQHDDGESIQYIMKNIKPVGELLELNIRTNVDGVIYELTASGEYINYKKCNEKVLELGSYLNNKYSVNNKLTDFYKLEINDVSIRSYCSTNLKNYDYASLHYIITNKKIEKNLKNTYE